jgi:Ca2+-transporting ATPase
VAGWPLPLLPLHLLWVNLVTDGLPALTLVLEPVSPSAMRRPPRLPSEPMLAPQQWRTVAVLGVFEGALVLAAFRWGLRGGDVVAARTLAFGTLVFCELFRAFAARSTSRLFWEVGAFTNVRLLAVVMISAAAQLSLHHVAGLRRLFQLAPMTMGQTAAALALGLVPVTAAELAKLARRMRTR